MKMISFSRLSLTILFFALAFATVAQTARPANGSARKGQGSTERSASPDTVKSVSKTEKDIEKGEAYVKLAVEKKNMLKSMFPSRKADTVYAIIAGIDYRDPNLKLLKQKMEKVKNTKGLTTGYHSGTVVIKIFYRLGDASLLYDSLDEDIKELFEVEDMEGARVILNYKRPPEK